PAEFRPRGRQFDSCTHIPGIGLGGCSRDRRRCPSGSSRHNRRRGHDLHRGSRRESTALRSERDLGLIRKLMTKNIRKIVLAYSGGLDTSVMLRWLKEHYQCEVVCYCADVGQGAELSGLEEKAYATGASK